MKYILDSSVAFKWSVPEVDSDKAIQLKDELAAARYARTRLYDLGAMVNKLPTDTPSKPTPEAHKSLLARTGTAPRRV